MRLPVIFAVLAITLAGPVIASDPPAEPELAASNLQFRDLFNRKMMPSDQAEALAGKRISLIGFVAPKAIPEAPYVVLAGAPVQFCPYCEIPEDQDQLPFLVVFADEELGGIGRRARVRVEGRLEVGAAFDEWANLTNHMRLRDARVVRDQPAANPSRAVRAKVGVPGAGFDVDADDN